MAGRVYPPVRRPNCQGYFAKTVSHSGPFRLLLRDFQCDGVRDPACGIIAGGNRALSDALVYGYHPHVT